MKNLSIKCIIIGLALSLPLNMLRVSNAQDANQVTSSIKKKSGVETVEFDTLVGTVEVNFPDDMSDTDTISGTVVAEPNGETKEEKAQNEDTLRGYVVEIEKTQEIPEPPPPPKRPPAKPLPPVKQPPCSGPKLPPIIYVVPEHHGGFTTAIPPKCGGIIVTIKNSGGTTICSKPVPTNPIPPKKPPGCTFPPRCNAGGPIRIPGPTDGCSWTTSVKANGQTCAPIAESPRQTICQAPGNLRGPCTVTKTECGQTNRGTITFLPPQSPPPPTKPNPPTTKNKYVFRRTGPFITRKNSTNANDELTVEKNQVTYTGVGVYNQDRRKSCSFSFSDLPETLTVGDHFSFTGQVSGDPEVSPLASFGCRSENLWTKLLNPPPLNFSNSKTLVGSFPGYVPSGTQSYEVLDGKKTIDEYKRNNPDKIASIKEETLKQIPMVLYVTAGAGSISVEFKWIYVLDDQPSYTCGFRAAQERAAKARK